MAWRVSTFLQNLKIYSLESYLLISILVKNTLVNWSIFFCLWKYFPKASRVSRLNFRMLRLCLLTYKIVHKHILLDNHNLEDIVCQDPMDFRILFGTYHKHILDQILSSLYLSCMLKESVTWWVLHWFQELLKSKWSTTWSIQWLMMWSFYFMLTQLWGTHFFNPNFQWWQCTLGGQSSCFWHQGYRFFMQVPLCQGLSLGQCSMGIPCVPRLYLAPLSMVSLKCSIAIHVFDTNFMIWLALSLFPMVSKHPVQQVQSIVVQVWLAWLVDEETWLEFLLFLFQWYPLKISLVITIHCNW